MTNQELTKPVCCYCLLPADGPMLVMGEAMAHADCVTEKLQELLDPDYEGPTIEEAEAAVHHGEQLVDERAKQRQGKLLITDPQMDTTRITI